MTTQDTKRKIYTVYKILKRRLPKGYCIPVKCFSSIYYLLQAVADELGVSYKKAKEIYNRYGENNTNKNDYLTTKYYKPREGIKHREDCFTCDAFAGRPIYIACDNVKYHTKAELAFLILHEIAHMFLKTNNERRCDLFARRWTRKLIKEGLL